MPQIYDIFLSYGHEDSEIAACIASRLDEAGVRCFTAEKDISASEQWEPRIRQALIDSRRVLLLITPRSKDSHWVSAEAGAAWALGTPLLPALMCVKPEELFDLVRSHQGRKVETPPQIHALVQEIKQLSRHGIQVAGICPIGTERPHESFTDSKHYEELLVIGHWIRNTTTGQLAGKGIGSYLLSHHKYGKRFVITASLRFAGCPPENVNAGFVFGWDTPTDVPRYYHIMFTGKRLLAEVIGRSGGLEVRDFQHINEGVPFVLQQQRPYALRISVDSASVEVAVDGATRYTVTLPEIWPGRVGLRPWQSTMICDGFEVSAIT